MKIIFFGTPVFSLPSLKAILNSKEEVLAVVTQPDKKKGRGRIITPSPVKEFALSSGIKIFQPENIRISSFYEELEKMKPDAIVVVAYGKILPPSIIHLPPYGCINLHASLLPKYRGAAPIQWAIMNGEKKTGITTMLMDEGLDTGDILLQKEVDIYIDDNAETLSKRLSEIGAELLIETLQGLRGETIKPRPQIGIPTYAPPLKKQDGFINWNRTANDIYNFVRGVYPWPGAFCYLNNKRLKINRVKVVEGSGIPGRIENASDELIVGTLDGLISIIELQLEGKKPMSSREFLKGYKLKTGSFLNEI